jgi:hypothetical protein
MCSGPSVYSLNSLKMVFCTKTGIFWLFAIWQELKMNVACYENLIHD